MGRKLAGQLLALAFLLAAIYGQQKIFAKEEPAERPLPYEVAFEEPDGWDGCYTVRPQVTITHPGPAGETVYVLEHDGGAGAQGRICEAGGQAVIGQEQFAEGVNRLRVWMEYAPPAEDEEPGAEEPDKEEPGAEEPGAEEPGAEEPDKEEPGAEEPGAEEPDTEGPDTGEPVQPGPPEILYEQTYVFRVDTRPPSLQAWIRGGNVWHQNQAEVDFKAEETPDGSGIKNIACYVNGERVRMTEEGSGRLTVEEPSRGGQGVPVRIEAWDRAGNTTSWEGEVYVDSAPPSLAVTGVTDYMITSRDVTALFRASDDNLLASCSAQTVWITPEGEETVLEGAKWSREGDSWQARQTFDRDGIYRMQVRARDQAGFQTEQSVQVIVDKSNPVISWVDEMDGACMQAFRWEKPVSEIITDFTSYTYTVTLDGFPCLPGFRTEREGRHILEVEAVDAAGNRSRADARFVIDHTAPHIAFEGVESGTAYEKEREVTVRLGDSADWIREIRVNGVRQKTGEKACVYTRVFQEEGVYELEVSATDLAGNVREASVIFEIVPEATLAQQLLAPVKESLGIEKDSLPTEEEKRRKEEKGEETPLYPAAASGILVLTVLAAVWYSRKKKDNKSSALR